MKRKELVGLMPPLTKEQKNKYSQSYKQIKHAMMLARIIDNLTWEVMSAILNKEIEDLNNKMWKDQIN